MSTRSEVSKLDMLLMDMACAWMADNPKDDRKRITKAWFLAKGAAQDSQGDLAIGPIWWSSSECAPVIEIEGIEGPVVFRTRRELRLICRAIKLPLKGRERNEQE